LLPAHFRKTARVHLPIVSRQPGHAAHSRWPITSSPVLVFARGSADNGQAVIPARAHLPPESKSPKSEKPNYGLFSCVLGLSAQQPMPGPSNWPSSSRARPTSNRPARLWLLLAVDLIRRLPATLGGTKHLFCLLPLKTLEPFLLPVP
jgi:hypothetical protein